ncbi:hypothetical protein GGX14DRAFT_421002 [Mycena pura]|uniref:Uncharacterized protein n=1 Tax=Mycena pura TaxID=153505 RepID=A0AAD6YPB9_9AGAR|nr:hypothetical protein GGX14DRAFT_421002 [Mycena pura]
MILPASPHKSQDELIPTAGPSSSPPPFQDDPPLVDFSDSSQIADVRGGEEPPPEFTPYEAECFSSGGDIVSHDPHLNTDGEALYRFLLSQSTMPPEFRLHCKGSHTETRHRHVTHRNSDGRTRMRTESYTETVVDFDFYIDASQLSGPVHWSVDDSEPAYRGGMVREIDSPEGKRKATRSEIKLFNSWVVDRTSRGLPPWISSVEAFSDMSANATVLKSSRTLRQWAVEYCASPKHLKEFIYEKVVYGWNIRQLENAIRAAIAAAPYRGNVAVEFTTSATKIYIRPDNKLSRMLSNKWFKFLSIILILPFVFIWLFKRFHSRGGGSWSVCGGAYALKSTTTAEPVVQDISTLKGLPPAAGDRSLIRTPAGSSRLVGMREGEWFRKWQPAIVRAVSNRFQSPTPLYHTAEEGIPQAYGLDGY